MPLSSNITTRNSTGEQVWAVSKYGYRSRHNYALLRTSGLWSKRVQRIGFSTLGALDARALPDNMSPGP
jgi:hypothetical protein